MASVGDTVSMAFPAAPAVEPMPARPLSALTAERLAWFAVSATLLAGIEGLMLSYVFGHTLHLFPAVGYCSLANLSTGCDGLSQWTYHLILPWFTFGLLNAAMFTMMARGLVLEELNQEYVRTARAKGAGPFRIVRGHLLKNVTLPLVTIIGLNAGTALIGVIFVESAFSLPGLGGILRQATLRRDLPMTAGSVIFFALAILVLNLLVDLAYMLLDPRLRFGSSAAARA